MAELQTAHTAELDAATLTAARALLYDVFDDMTDHDWEQPWAECTPWCGKGPT